MHKDLIRKELKKLQEEKKELRKNIETIQNKEEAEEMGEEIRNISEKEMQLRNKLDEIVRNDEGDAIIPETKLTDEQIRSLKPVYIHEEEKQVRSKEDWLESEDYKNAFAKVLMRKKHTLTNVEKRALESVTTTNTNFVEATSTVVGENNAGLFIPKSINTEILERVSLESAIFNDINKYNIPGEVNFPYKDYSKGVSEKKETENNDTYVIKFKNLNIGQAEISTTALVSWKTEKMTVKSFLAYFVDEIVKEMKLKLINGVIYGKGTDTELTGITNGEGTYKIDNESDVYNAINKALNKLSKEDRAAAKIYISEGIARNMLSAKDSNGRPFYSMINGETIKSILNKKAEIDNYLEETDILIGNPEEYKFNQLADSELIIETKGRERRNEYTAYTLVGGKPVPKKWVYIKMPSA